MEDHKAYAIKLFLPFSLKAQRSKAKLLSLPVWFPASVPTGEAGLGSPLLKHTSQPVLDFRKRKVSSTLNQVRPYSAIPLQVK